MELSRVLMGGLPRGARELGGWPAGGGREGMGGGAQREVHGLGS